ncbi:4-(cytidine 5'-diphospho)-2-C-methyl-D-erythritol kinase [Limnoglobus roseus]|uniref:4-diphosphocytidyl-2-C-methyl-D-erythritol kinase n=1 Tax=Limnoglobus roseus TaxID=2598579 RepID=A0A5C1A940_9BACT|nr:4-(cytidine 5'-diphospho)-2-C-methyl-D-erythritol kinase [Limnoglobus roseus]QEL15230.1 4-(cytidine 5'-diphospho)-2-C-methyl-D-erythritol kinase [Limnoglobus roseus]
MTTTGPPPASVIFTAPAKINLTLEVVAKRYDGFHAIESLMVPVDPCDTLEFQATAGELTLTCDQPGIPVDGRNLVVKAAEALRRAVGTRRGAVIRLTKRIPHEAGLGGGSSDAATTLLALNELWGANLPTAYLAKVAAEIGSDVAFFLVQTAGWCTGRGEIVMPQEIGRPLDLVIVKPAVGLSTKEIYSRVVVPTTPLDGTPARDALRAGDVSALGRALFNRLQAPAFAVAPAVESLYRELAALEPLGCQLSGSGSALFALCRDALEANRIAEAVRQKHVSDPQPPQVFVSRTRPASPPNRITLARNKESTGAHHGSPHQTV